jgi:hypothetical protein
MESRPGSPVIFGDKVIGLSIRLVHLNIVKWI